MLQIVQAYDRTPFAELPYDDASALERKLTAAERAVRDRDARLPAHARIAVLQAVARRIAEQRDHFSRQIAREGGKPLTDARIEVDRAVDGVRNAAEALRDLAGREIPMGLTPASEGRWAFTTREPIGVVAAISAFNHPLNLIVHQVAPAIAVGCPVIVKPASATPLSCFDFVRLVHEAGLPEPWCQTFLPATNDLAEALATDPRVAFVSFIGSARVGWHLHGRLAPGTRSALEHGGVAPAIVDRSADLDAIITPLVKGGYYHAGQVCVSTQRIFVHAEIEAAFTERFLERVAELRVGDPLLPDTEVGPLIQPREADRVRAWIDEAVARGARLTGGERLSKTTLNPAVLQSPAREARVSREEVFGPVTCLYRYDDLDAAIATANALPFAFQASVFAQDLGVALRAAERLDASAVMVNDATAFRTDWMPFAGRRNSGYGVGGIPYTMRDMTQEKMVVLRR
ncbi:aldehyde dehydrogenase family protein [Methylobacterium sp. J-078]|uniref:aldehyde dehydrogenase family protein n=1 Tax=Methylobacterium sp. J-078 TaxID=2836657 RepID=UPI001FBB8C8E|nr:aldehyde dehydrogenase family protein [Methylobacterium sp. J-078]MCJ2047720.1 aldehyde dehydrogenase family protein [Methylobacterium sp. J-078]